MKRIRAKKMKEVSDQHIASFMESFCGSHRPVLWERSNREGYMSGFTDNYIRLIAPYEEDCAERITLAKVGKQVKSEEYCYADEVQCGESV